MKTYRTKTMIVAAALMAVAGVGSAQTMEAKIPFAFRASGKVLAPGTYHINMRNAASGTAVLVVSGAEGGKILSVAFPNGEAKKSWLAAQQPVLSFACGVSRCVLHEIWSGQAGTPAYLLPTPKLGRDEPRRTAEIVMQNVKAD